MKHACLFVLVLVFVGAGMHPVAAQEHIQEDVVAELDEMGDRLVRLAEAVPAELYDWRPGEGVRSFGEVFTHVASSNYFVADRLGTPVPEDVDRQAIENAATEKEVVISELARAFDHLSRAVRAVEDGELSDTVAWFGGTENTKRGVLLMAVRHTGEHLGQLVAYTRVNDLVPPWSQ